MTQQPSHIINKKLHQKQQYYAPIPTLGGTICLLLGIATAFISYPSQIGLGTSAMASAAAIPVGLGFVGSVLLDTQKGLRNLFRTDLMCLAGIYGLTLAEFLFPQEEFNTWATVDEIAIALNITLVGIASLAIGRHLVKPQKMKSKWLSVDDISNNALFQVLLISAFFGYLYMLMSVDFNIFKMVDAMMGARFSQPWGRSRIGGLVSLLTELSLMTYIVPPLTGIIINRYKTFPKPQFITILFIFILVMFSAFAGGTRNVLVAHIATFLMGYLLTLEKNTLLNSIVPIVLSLWLVSYASYHMLEFRTMGLNAYLENRVYDTEKVSDTFAVDYNLASIGWVASAMPNEYPYLGTELIYWSLIKPIPRVFFPGKPEDLSVSVEEIAGAEGWTVAVTYLGEAYMSAGMLGVICISLFFGALAAWWNRMAITPQSDYGFVIYALGFFAAGLTMRSMLWLSTAILPVIALIVLRKYGPFK